MKDKTSSEISNSALKDFHKLSTEEIVSLMNSICMKYDGTSFNPENQRLFFTKAIEKLGKNTTGRLLSFIDNYAKRVRAQDNLNEKEAGIQNFTKYLSKSLKYAMNRDELGHTLWHINETLHKSEINPPKQIPDSHPFFWLHVSALQRLGEAKINLALAKVQDLALDKRAANDKSWNPHKYFSGILRNMAQDEHTWIKRHPNDPKRKTHGPYNLD